MTKAYRKLAMRWHPDRPGGDDTPCLSLSEYLLQVQGGAIKCQSRRRLGGDDGVFSSIADAYDVLTDPEKREIFDRIGQGGLDRLRDGAPNG